MKFEIGKSYKARNGDKMELRLIDSRFMYFKRVSPGLVNEDLVAADHFGNRVSSILDPYDPYDIIEEWVEPRPASKTVWINLYQDKGRDITDPKRFWTFLTDSRHPEMYCYSTKEKAVYAGDAGGGQQHYVTSFEIPMPNGIELDQ